METLITGGNGLRDGVVLTAALYLRHARPGVTAPEQPRGPAQAAPASSGAAEGRQSK